MRVGEIIELTWDCVDFEHGVIHIEKQLVQTRVKGQDYVFGTLKNGKTRVIAPVPFVMEVLKKHKADQEEQKREMGDLWDEGKFPGLVFVQSSGWQPLFPADDLEGIPEHSGSGRSGASPGARSEAYLRGEQHHGGR